MTCSKKTIDENCSKYSEFMPMGMSEDENESEAEEPKPIKKTKKIVQESKEPVKKAKQPVQKAKQPGKKVKIYKGLDDTGTSMSYDEYEKYMKSRTHYDHLATLNYSKYHSYTSKEEHIDVDKLSFLVNNKDIFEPMLDEGRGLRGVEKNDVYEPFLMAKKYLAKAKNGVVPVRYRQKNNVGRFTAVGGLSLQGLTRQIRQTIAGDFYMDIDMKNAHPTILKWVCDQCEIDCEILSKYVNDRAGFFKSNGVSKSVGKQVVLSVINGGRKAYRKLKNPSKDLEILYKIEIPKIHKALRDSIPMNLRTIRNERMTRVIQRGIIWVAL